MGPVSGEAFHITNNWRHQEGQNKDCSGKGERYDNQNGESTTRVPASHPYTAYEFDHWPENYGKESAHVDQQQDVAHLVGDKNPQGNAKCKQQFGAVTIRHNKCRRPSIRAPRCSSEATTTTLPPISVGRATLSIHIQPLIRRGKST